MEGLLLSYYSQTFLMAPLVYSALLPLKTHSPVYSTSSYCQAPMAPYSEHPTRTMSTPSTASSISPEP